MPGETPSKDSEKTILILKAEMDRIVDGVREIASRVPPEAAAETEARAVCWSCAACGHALYFSIAASAAECGSCPECQTASWQQLV